MRGNKILEKQRLIEFIGEFTFEYTKDLSGDVLIHTPKIYDENELSKAVTQFIGLYSLTILKTVNRFNGFDKVNYIINNYEG